MARKSRVHFDGAIYHVIVRGNNRERVFDTDEEKAKYLEFLADYRERYGFQIYAYVIMSNHVHLLIRIATIPLAKIMQGIQQRYTQYYNCHYQHTGHVFEQRYKAFLCKEENYLITLVCYIHQNPMRANIPGGIEYRWSSHQAYMNGKSSFLDITFILDIFNADREKAIEQYYAMLGLVIEKEKYKKESETSKSSKREVVEILGKVQPQITWEQLVKRITEEEQVNQEQLLERCRIRKVVAARKLLIYEAVENNVMTRQQLARALAIDPANITRIIQEIENRNKSILNNSSQTPMVNKSRTVSLSGKFTTNNQ